MSKDKINFSHDPENVLNAFLSMSRNFFLTASISIAILGISRKSILANKKTFLILALLMMMFSIIYGIKSTLDFNNYLNYLRENKYFKNDYIKTISQRWKGWIYINILFLIPLILGLLFGIYKLFN